MYRQNLPAKGILFISPTRDDGSGTRGVL